MTMMVACEDTDKDLVHGDEKWWVMVLFPFGIEFQQVTWNTNP